MVLVACQTVTHCFTFINQIQKTDKCFNFSNISNNSAVHLVIVT